MAERDGPSIFRKLPARGHPLRAGRAGQAARRWSTTPSSPNRSAPASESRSQRQVALMGTQRPPLRHARRRPRITWNCSTCPAASRRPMTSTQAYVRITRGCNKFCTYCVVPYTRGPEVHRPPQNIIDEVKKLADAGVAGSDAAGPDGQPLPLQARRRPDDQLRRAAVPGPRGRARICRGCASSPASRATSPMRRCRRCATARGSAATCTCRPRAASDRILRLMNRGYTARRVPRLHRPRPRDDARHLHRQRLHRRLPHRDRGGVRADRASWSEHCRFKNSFIFKYSPRPGTTRSSGSPTMCPRK